MSYEHLVDLLLGGALVLLVIAYDQLFMQGSRHE
jgi:hypothetical protein